MPLRTEMTVRQAITALLDDFHLEEFEEVFRDEAKQDRAFHGMSSEHPRVQRFRAVCQTLRAVIADLPVVGEGP